MKWNKSVHLELNKDGQVKGLSKRYYLLTYQRIIFIISIDEGQTLLDEHVVYFTKFLWSQHGKSIPEDFIISFEIYD